MKLFALSVVVASMVMLSACSEKAETQPTAAAKPTEQAVAPSSPPQATEVAGGHPGKGIHDANCISCHDSGVYTRADRKMTDLTMLAAQVRRCDANLGTKLFDEDMGKVTDYLNETYYKFPKP